MSQTVGCETQMNCDDSWVPSCLFFFLRFVHIWLYIFLSPDLTHQYLYFLKLAPPWIIPLKDFFFLNNRQFLGILLSRLSFPQIHILKPFFASHLRISFDHFLIYSFLVVLYSSVSLSYLKCLSILFHLQAVHTGHISSPRCFDFGHFLSSW